MKLDEDSVQAIIDRHLEDVEVLLVEVTGNRARRIVRVFLDYPGGVTHDLCGRLSHALGQAIEANNLIDGPYSLEVSSPGLDRPLRKPEHFAAQVGRRISVRTQEPVDGRKAWQGELVQADAEAVELLQDGRQVRIPFSKIARANLIYEFNRGETA